VLLWRRIRVPPPARTLLPAGEKCPCLGFADARLQPHLSELINWGGGMRELLPGERREGEHGAKQKARVPESKPLFLGVTLGGKHLIFLSSEYYATPNILSVDRLKVGPKCQMKAATLFSGRQIGNAISSGSFSLRFALQDAQIIAFKLAPLSLSLSLPVSR